VRRTPLVALTSLVLAAALILSGCSGSRPDPDLKALPEVSGDPGAQPTLSWSGPTEPVLQGRRPVRRRARGAPPTYLTSCVRLRDSRQAPPAP